MLFLLIHGLQTSNAKAGINRLRRQVRKTQSNAGDPSPPAPTRSLGRYHADPFGSTQTDDHLFPSTAKPWYGATRHETAEWTDPLRDSPVNIAEYTPLVS
ncbi:hypothetical protein BD309DRAFT_145840 [Dichomitus squalens]|nr:hypothetical protein BD309DRAFT_145840 [Dichomitus squalens]